MAILHRATLPLLLLSALTSRSAAQGLFHAHVDAIAVHDYRWRGIKRTSGWNAQLEATARVGRANTGLALGVWSNFELATHRNGALTDLPADHWGLSEASFWGELAHSFGAGDVAAGFIWYEYRGRAGKLGTGEVYGRLRGSGRNPRKLAPEISLWYDVAKRKSGYLEAGATAPVLALPFRGVGVLAYVSGNAGVAVGEPERRSELAATTFNRKGFTSADLSAGFRVNGEKSAGGIIVLAALHLQVARDSATRRKWLDPVEYHSSVRTYITLGIGIRWPAPKDR